MGEDTEEYYNRKHWFSVGITRPVKDLIRL